MYMLRAAWLASLLAMLAASPLSAQEPETPNAPLDPAELPRKPGILSGFPLLAYAADPFSPPEGETWQTAWGLIGLRAIPAGVRTAPNGLEYHQNFSIDLN